MMSRICVLFHIDAKAVVAVVCAANLTHARVIEDQLAERTGHENQVNYV